MLLSTISPTQVAGGQIALTAFLALAGFFLLLPRPNRASVAGGIACLIAAIAVFCIWLQTHFGNPMPDSIGTALFWLFSVGALVFGSVLVIQPNPARGAIAFAFVILSTCGLFLLLAAPFLMAATIIIYAGAIIVTFLFVLMLSQPRGQSDENDRSREPLFGALAGFAFTGLVLFGLYLTAIGRGEVRDAESETATQRLPALELTVAEREQLKEVVAQLDAADGPLNGTAPASVAERVHYFEKIKEQLAEVVGVSNEDPGGVSMNFHKPKTDTGGGIRGRLEQKPGRAGAGAVLYREDQQTRGVLTRANAIRGLNWRAFHSVELLLMDREGDPAAVKAQLRTLRDEVLLLGGAGDLPERNVENLGYLLYADYLLAIELAGTLLLVATIGAIAIAHREGCYRVITLWHYLAVAAAIFGIGLVGFLTRRNLITMFLCAEMMLQGVAINFCAFARYHGNLQGQVFVLFILTVAACEAGVALALILMLYRRGKSLDVSVWQSLRERGLPPTVETEPLPMPLPETPEERLPLAGVRPMPSTEEAAHV